MNKNEATKCPKFEKCPIFKKNVLHTELIGQTYKNLYCVSEENKYQSCVRYIVAEKYGKPAPEKILPNSSLSIDEIARQMSLN